MGKKAKKSIKRAFDEKEALMAELHEIEKKLNESSKEKKCDFCVFLRKGECGGCGHICSDYQQAYIASKEITDQWPDGKYMGVNYRSGTTRLSGEHAFSKNREDYSYIYNDYGERVYGYWY